MIPADVVSHRALAGDDVALQIEDAFGESTFVVSTEGPRTMKGQYDSLRWQAKRHRDRGRFHARADEETELQK